MKKITFLTFSVVVVFFVGVVILMSSSEKGTVSTDNVSVRLKWIYQAQFAGFFTAEQKGFYEEQGIDVDIIPGGAESPSIQMVAGGGEDFGVTGMSQLMEARAKGVPIVAVAVIYRKNPLIWFSVNDQITTAEDLIGKKVGVTIGSNSDILFRAMLKKAQVNIEDVEMVPVTYDISPVLTGQVDAYEGYVINQPITAKEKGFTPYIINPVDYGINFYADTLFTTEKLIQDNPDLVKRFVEATLKGWEYSYQYPAEAVEFTLAYSDQLNSEHETSMMQASLELLKPDTKPIGTIEKSVLQEMQSLLVNNGIIKTPLDIDTMYTTRFLK